MCGITGFIDHNKKSSKEMLDSMTDVLEYRGPDDRGTLLIEKESYFIGLGHRRLSILDLSACGHQPMKFLDLIIIYNGEIYNFAEIKKELENTGYVFDSHSDTEVILKAFHRWGPDCVHRFIGMFAFALYDGSQEKLYLFRDRPGVKPLYCFQKNGLTLFASELKSLMMHPSFRKVIDYRSLKLFFQYGYIPAPSTIFCDTWKVLPGYYYLFDCKTGAVGKNKYWNVLDYYNQPLLDIDEEDAMIELKKKLSSAFEYRMVSDVPVGLFLSGGYDSSAVAALLQSGRTEKIKTFTIGFYEKQFNEAHYAKEVAKFLGTDHTEYYCTQKEALSIIPELPAIYDEPFGDSSTIPTVLVSRLARKAVKVSLSADAGDETFAGYGKYDTSLRYHKLFSSMPPFITRLLNELLSHINPDLIPGFNKSYNHRTRYNKFLDIMKSTAAADAMKFVSHYISTKELSSYILNDQVDSNPTFFSDDGLFLDSVENLNRLCAIDYKTYMVDDILVKVDRATMSISLEGREPLLDHRIIEFMSRLPARFKLRNRETKFLFKKLVHGLIPIEMMNRPKMGFGVPIIHWFRNDLRSYLYEYLNSTRLQKEGLLNPEAVVQLRDSYLSGKSENVQKLWFFLMFEMWYERWM